MQVNSIGSMERQRLVSNIVRAAKAAVTYGLPIVHSAVDVKTGINKPSIAPLRKVLDKVQSTTVRRSILGKILSSARQSRPTGCKKLTMTALWTEACLTFRRWMH